MELAIANSNESLFVDTSQSTVDITLPTPKDGAKVWITDLKSNFDTNKVVVLRNGAKIMGVDSNLDVDKKNISFLLHCVEVDDTIYDWRIR